MRTAVLTDPVCLRSRRVRPMSPDDDDDGDDIDDDDDDVIEEEEEEEEETLIFLLFIPEPLPIVS